MSPDPMVPVKVGVIGIGNMGWHHARVLSLLRDDDSASWPKKTAFPVSFGY